MTLAEINKKIYAGEPLSPKEIEFAQRTYKQLAKKGQLSDDEDSFTNFWQQYTQNNPVKMPVTSQGMNTRMSSRSMDDILASMPEKDTQGDFQSRNMKAQTAGQYATDALKGGVGLTQFIKGRKIQKNTKEPKKVNYTYNSGLATRLADAQRQSQMADPLIQSKAMSELANNRFYMDKVGKAISGDATSYGAFAQINADKMNNAVRNLAVDEIENKLRKQALFDNLLAQSQSERQFDFNNKVDQYRVDLGQYNQRQQYGQDLVDSGVSNMMGAVDNMLGNSPMVSYMNALREKRSNNNNRAEGMTYPTWSQVKNW